MTRRFAVVGSGASGCYAVEALLRRDPQARVDVIERLPTPFGLIRYGVAPDHQGTKAVFHTLERFLGHERVRYFGNITIGRDISIEELLAAYDGVILATGINRDRKLCVPGEELEGVMGSGVLACWYNDHPEAFDARAMIARARRVVVIGSGNVALDIVRVLTKDPREFVGSDLSPATTVALDGLQIETIAVIGRRGPTHNKFSLHEFREVAGLASVRVRLDPVARALGVDAAGSKANVLQELLALPDLAEQPSVTGAHASKRDLHFHFGLEPTAFLPSATAQGRVGAVRFDTMAWQDGAYVRTARQVVLPADLVITCIGYEFHDHFGLGTRDGVLEHDNGRIRERLYVVGWAKRGASGTIGTNRSDSHTVAAKVCAEVPGTADNSMRNTGIEPLARARGLQWVDHTGWKRINQAEIDAAGPDRVRCKLTNRGAQLAVGAAPAGTGHASAQRPVVAIGP